MCVCVWTYRRQRCYGRCRCVYTVIRFDDVWLILRCAIRLHSHISKPFAFLRKRGRRPRHWQRTTSQLNPDSIARECFLFHSKTAANVCLWHQTVSHAPLRWLGCFSCALTVSSAVFNLFLASSTYLWTRSFKVNAGGAIRQFTYDFLLVFLPWSYRYLFSASETSSMRYTNVYSGLNLVSFMKFSDILVPLVYLTQCISSIV